MGGVAFMVRGSALVSEYFFSAHYYTFKVIGVGVSQLKADEVTSRRVRVTIHHVSNPKVTKPKKTKKEKNKIENIQKLRDS